MLKRKLLLANNVSKKKKQATRNHEHEVMSIRASCIRFASILIGSTLLLSACSKRKPTQEALKPLELFYADQLAFDETSRDTLRSSPVADKSKVSPSVPEQKPPSRAQIRSQMLEHQARLVDIPVPLQSTPLERYFYAQEGTVTLGYDVRGYVSDYMLFYEQGLERSGWRKVTTLSTDFESLLVYDKPERFCIISLRHATISGNIPIRIMLYTGIKEEGLS
jgi:hypothetical protein